ncbi:CPCC family cysteine-rich protein [Planobispora siamensis]|uniref:CPCC family cysteine-rich protein n=1 Tax=Planobispora siamensis TaxID=936338 RepID=UPI0019518020|nr:CPCC family cysteine-rich protein [Planobispora siamensis]
MAFVDIVRPQRDEPYPCPFCGFLTLGQRGMHEICPVCFWEDDGQDDHDAGNRSGRSRAIVFQATDQKLEGSR